MAGKEQTGIGTGNLPTNGPDNDAKAPRSPGHGREEDLFVEEKDIEGKISDNFRRAQHGTEITTSQQEKILDEIKTDRVPSVGIAGDARKDVHLSRSMKGPFLGLEASVLTRAHDSRLRTRNPCGKPTAGVDDFFSLDGVWKLFWWFP